MPVEKKSGVDREFQIVAPADEYLITIPFHEFTKKLYGVVFAELGMTVLPPGTTVEWSFMRSQHPLDRDETVDGIQAKVIVPCHEFPPAFTTLKK